MDFRGGGSVGVEIGVRLFQNSSVMMPSFTVEAPTRSVTYIDLPPPFLLSKLSLVEVWLYSCRFKMLS